MPQRLGVQDRVADGGGQADRSDLLGVLRHPLTVAGIGGANIGPRPEDMRPAGPG
jgi:hypothetical protein